MTTLEHSANLARGDLALACNGESWLIQSRYLQTIRMITEALDDAKEFKVTWERWREEDKPIFLPTFEHLMMRNNE